MRTCKHTLCSVSDLECLVQSCVRNQWVWPDSQRVVLLGSWVALKRKNLKWLTVGAAHKFQPATEMQARGLFTNCPTFSMSFLNDDDFKMLPGLVFSSVPFSRECFISTLWSTLRLWNLFIVFGFSLNMFCLCVSKKSIIMGLSNFISNFNIQDTLYTRDQ